MRPIEHVTNMYKQLYSLLVYTTNTIGFSVVRVARPQHGPKPCPTVAQEAIPTLIPPGISTTGYTRYKPHLSQVLLNQKKNLLQMTTFHFILTKEKNQDETLHLHLRHCLIQEQWKQHQFPPLMYLPVSSEISQSLKGNEKKHTLLSKTLRSSSCSIRRLEHIQDFILRELGRS